MSFGDFLQFVLPAFVAILTSVIAYTWKHFTEKIEELERSSAEAMQAVHDFKFHVAQNYSTVQSFDKFENRIVNMLDKIEKKLDRIVDLKLDRVDHDK